MEQLTARPNKAHDSRSGQYKLAKTAEIIDCLRNEGYEVDSYQEARTNKDNRKGFQKHLVHFSHPRLPHLGDSKVQLLLRNSHDGSQSLQLFLGIYRFVCANGMIVGQSFGGFSIRHRGSDFVDRLFAGVYKTVNQAETLAETVETMKRTYVTRSLALDAFRPVFESRLTQNRVLHPVDSVGLLSAQRHEDATTSVWHRYNVAQEKLMRGLYRTAKIEDGELTKIRKARPVVAIDQKVKLNAALFDTATQLIVAA